MPCFIGRREVYHVLNSSGGPGFQDIGCAGVPHNATLPRKNRFRNLHQHHNVSDAAYIGLDDGPKRKLSVGPFYCRSESFPIRENQCAPAPLSMTRPSVSPDFSAIPHGDALPT